MRKPKPHRPAMARSRHSAPFTPWPLFSSCQPTLAKDEHLRIERLATTLKNSTPLRRAATYETTLLHSNVSTGWARGPTLWAEDHRGIEFVAEPLARGFEYRSLGLAGDGDTLLISRPHEVAFERYMREDLGLGSPYVFRLQLAQASGGSLCAACLQDTAALATLAHTARQKGILTVAPYQSSGHAWRLAAAVANTAGVPVKVAAASPPLVRIVNDKLWFAHTARSLLGGDSLPPSWGVYGPAAAAYRLATLSQRYEQLVLKARASAGALGNVVIEADTIRGYSLGTIRHRLLDALSHLGGKTHWPLLLSVWEDAVLASPSLQCWIPAHDEGMPLLEGMYEQRFSGKRGAFIGASETRLVQPLAERFEREGLQLSLLLQRLGYVGRASFDALVIGPTWENTQLHWVECNARWGGVSIPMCVSRRLGIRPSERATVIARAPLDTMPDSFDSILDASAGRHYDHASRTGVLWLTPPSEEGGDLHFAAIGTSMAAASSLASATITGIIAQLGRKSSRTTLRRTNL